MSGVAALPNGDVDKTHLLTVDYWRRKVGEFSGRSIDDELPPKPKPKSRRKPGKPGPKKGSTRKKKAPAKPKKPAVKAAEAKPAPVKVAPPNAPVSAAPHAVEPDPPAPSDAPRPPPGYDGYEPPPPPKPPRSAPAVKSIVARPESAPAMTREPSEARQLPLNLEDFNPEHLGDVSKAELDKVKIFQQARTAAIKADHERGKLILRDTVRRVFANIATVHKSELRAFEDRLAPEICAIFGVQEDADESVEVRKLLNMETTKILRHIQVLVAEYVEGHAAENGAA